MRHVVGFLVRGRGWQVAFGAGALAAVMLWWALAVSGSLSDLDFDERQNIEFFDALHGPRPLPAIRAARELDEGFVVEMLGQLAESANRVLQAEEPHDFEGTRPAAPERARWVDTYVCGLKGWGQHRPVVRKLVVEGFGECGRLAQVSARSDWSAVVVILSWLLFLALIAATIWLWLVRRAYHWLYASRTH